MKTMNGFLKKTMLPFAAILLLALTFSACKKDNDNVRTPAAGLMVANLVPDSDPLGVAVGGNIITSLPLYYTNYSGGYQALFVGERTLETFDFNTRESLASTKHNFKDSTYYSMFVMGANDTYSNVLVEDNFDGLTDADMAYVRYVNAIPDSSNLQVTIMAADAEVFNSASAFKSVTEFKSVNPGEVSITVKGATDIDDSRTVTLEKNKVYTILLIGEPGDDTNGTEIKMIENGTVS